MRILLLLLLMLSAPLAQAKKTQLYIQFSQFMTDEQDSYLEMYFSIDAASLDYAQLPSGQLQGGLNVTVAVYQDSTLITGDKFRILSPQYRDTSAIKESLLHQQRFLLEPGPYRFEIDIEDINDADEWYSFKPELELNLQADSLSSSDLLFLEHYEKSSGENSQYVRSGYELLPIITSGTPFFPAATEELSFYLEIYNLDKTLGQAAPYLLKYYLQDALEQKTLNAYAGFKRKKASTVEPVLATFNIADLPSGNYELVIEALNKQGESVLKKTAFFYRANSQKSILPGQFENAEITGTWANSLGNLDSIYRFIEYLYPISSDQERAIQEGLLQAGDEQQLKRYFYAFWNEKNPLDPAGQWQKYHRKIRVVNRLYTTGMRPGYRSDRGRVHLTYGKPDQIDRRTMEPQMPPYEIWQYNKINTAYVTPQTNRMFVFGEFDPSTGEYQLFHSTAIGELKSTDWRQDLYFRAYGGSRTIDPNHNPNDREFGTRSRQNIILNSTGTDR